MKQALTFIVIVLCGTLGTAYAIDTLSRTGENQSIVQSGTTTRNGSTVIESGSTTNLYQMIVVTAAVSGSATASTNTFSTAFLATPTIVPGSKSGSSQNAAGYGVVVPTATTTSLIVTGMNSAGSTNNLPFIIYGYQRTGKLQ